MSTESLAFKDWIKSEGLLFEEKLSSFEGAQLVFEADEYLYALLTKDATREPLLPALGGLPFGLEQHVNNDLQHFKDAGIIPVFVFNGLDLACRDQQTISRESRKASSVLREAWRMYDSNNPDDAVLQFSKACTYRSQHISQHLFFHLHKNGVHVLNAPYNAAAQAVQILRDDAAHGIVGSASSLVFGAPKVILDFDWSKRVVYYTDLHEITTKLALNHDQFVDLCLLSGSSILPVLPEYDEVPTSKMAGARTAMNRAAQDGHVVCLQAKDEHYLGLYRKARVAIRHMVICKADGEIKQLNYDASPNDLHLLIGERLPDELFAYFSRGLISSRILEWRTRQEIFETPPLDGGNAPQYRALIQDKLRAIRARSLAILTSSLHRYYQYKDVDLLCWFDESNKDSSKETNKKPIGVMDAANGVARDAVTWHITDALMNDVAATENIDLNTSPIQYAIALLSDDAVAQKTITRRESGQHALLNTPSEILINTVCRFLQDRGYINSDHTLSTWGKTLKAAFAEAVASGILSETPSSPPAAEALFTVFELFRLDLLNAKQPFNPPSHSGGPMRGNDTDKNNTMVLSHIACLGPFTHPTVGYTGPLSKHLLAYQQTIVALQNSLRDLLEVHACHLLLNASAKRQRAVSEYTDIGARLPFSSQNTLGLALLVKTYLDELSNENAKQPPRIKPWFGHASGIDADLARAWKMWAAVNTGIQAADSGIVTSETKDAWRNIDDWLKTKLHAAETAAPTTNGA